MSQRASIRVRNAQSSSKDSCRETFLPTNRMKFDHTLFSFDTVVVKFESDEIDLRVMAPIGRSNHWGTRFRYGSGGAPPRTTGEGHTGKPSRGSIYRDAVLQGHTDSNGVNVFWERMTSSC